MTSYTGRGLVGWFQTEGTLPRSQMVWYAFVSFIQRPRTRSTHDRRAVVVSPIGSDRTTLKLAWRPSSGINYGQPTYFWTFNNKTPISL